MPGKSVSLSQDTLDLNVGGQVLTAEATLYFALFTTTPADDNTGGVEVSGNGYTRSSVANNLTEFPAATTTATGATKDNANDIVFPTAVGGSWGTVVGVGVYDAPAVGNLLWVNDVVVAKSVDDGDTARFPAGTLVWTEA